jgi:dTDP-4-dehydrorhamnose 3,5-epimerase
MLYLHTELYTPQCEEGLNFNDPKLNIKWPLIVTEISDKDRMYPMLTDNFSGLTL